MPRKTKNEAPEPFKPFSLTYTQGRTFRLDGLDWLNFARSLSEKSDKEKLEACKDLEAYYKVPKMQIRTRYFNDKGEIEETQHTNVPLYAEDDGFTLTIPQVFREEPKIEFLINDLLFEYVSFEESLLTEWEEYDESVKLSQKTIDQAKKLRDLQKLMPSSEEIRKKREEELPGVTEDRDNLIVRYRALFNDDNATEAQIKNVIARRNLAETRVKELEAEIEAFDDTVDLEQVLTDTTVPGKELKRLNAEVFKLYMAFVHRYAVRENMTELSLDEWLEMAKDQDNFNGRTWVDLGKAPKTSGRGARPVTLEEKRQWELRKTKGLPN